MFLSCLTFAERFRSIKDAMLLWVLVAKSQCKRQTQTLRKHATHNHPEPRLSIKPSSTSAIFVLRLMSPSKDCNRYGIMVPQRHARPSTKQRSQRTILKSTMSPAASSRTHEPAQQNAVRNSSPPQNEQDVWGESGSIVGSSSSHEQ